MNQWGRRTFLAAAWAFVATCSVAAADEPPWPTREWSVSAPDAEGMDADALARLVDFGAAGQMDSLLVVRHGRIVLDATYAPFRPGMRHALNSATKSVVSTLVAIAIGKGMLEGTGQHVTELFPDRRIAGLDERKQAMTIKSLLDMTSGIDWSEPLDGAPQTWQQLRRSPDWAQFILDRPMARAPGAAFNYSCVAARGTDGASSRRTGSTRSSPPRSRCPARWRPCVHYENRSGLRLDLVGRAATD